MLRELKNRHVAPLIMGFNFTTTSSPSIVARRESYNLSAFSRLAAGQVSATFKNAFARAPLMVGCCGTNIADTGPTFNQNNSTPVATGFQLLTEEASAGTDDDGDSYCWIMGWQSSQTDTTFPHLVKNTGVKPRIEFFKIDGASGTITIGSARGTLTKLGTGLYTLSYKKRFNRNVVPIAATFSAGAGRQPRIQGDGVASTDIYCFNLSGVAEDQVVHLAVLGWDSTVEVGSQLDPVLCSQRLPRLMGGRITNAGSAVVTIGSEDFTAVRNSAGLVTITFLRTFARAPIVIPTSKSSRACINADATASTVQIATRNVTTDAAADDNFDFIVVGSDDATSY